MIPKQEILEIAKDSKLPPHVVEKDYVLGWILWGMSHNQELLDHWIFKGGTCLKKCYFDSYRMSEDLDFTLTKESHLNEPFLINAFSNVRKLVYEASGIEFPEDRMGFNFYQNPRGKTSCEGKIFYKAPLTPASPRQTPKIKLDLSVDEILVEEPVSKMVDHKYSDLLSADIHVNCYSYVEIFAEKIRALTDRARPRDLYDVIHFFRRPESKNLASEIRRVLTRKCEFKDILFPTYSKIGASKDLCAIGWVDQLSHQLPELPPFESFWEDVKPFLTWLHNHDEGVDVLPTIADDRVHQVVTDIWHQGLDVQKVNILNRMQFAAANHLCVEVDYFGDDKTRHKITVAPYSLRKAEDLSLGVYGTNEDTKQTICLKVDRILKVNLTTNFFRPLFQIDFLPQCQV